MKNKIDKYFSTASAMQAGIHQRVLRHMLDTQKVIRIKKGLYRKSDIHFTANQSFADIAVALNNGVICLLSALAYHKLTTFNPAVVSVAIPYGARAPKIHYPPAEFYRFSSAIYKIGVDLITISGIKLKIYCPEKTICDCFRFRNKLGVDVAKEGLREYLKYKNRNFRKLMEYAKICRVKPIVEIWLNALT